MHSIEVLNQQLQDKLKALEEEFDNLRRINAQMDLDLMNARANEYKIIDLTNRINNLNNEVHRLNALLNDKLAEIDRLNKIISELEDENFKLSQLDLLLKDCEKRNQSLVDEVNRIKQLLEHRTDELNEWRRKYSEIEPVVD